jgi:hypothetical protein
MLKDRVRDREFVGFLLVETEGVTETESGMAAVNPMEDGGIHTVERISAHSPA